MFFPLPLLLPLLPLPSSRYCALAFSSLVLIRPISSALLLFSFSLLLCFLLVVFLVVFLLVFLQELLQEFLQELQPMQSNSLSSPYNNAGEGVVHFDCGDVLSANLLHLLLLAFHNVLHPIMLLHVNTRVIKE